MAWTAKTSITKKRQSARLYTFMDKVHPDDRRLMYDGIYGQEDKVRFLCDNCGKYFSIRVVKYINGQRHKCNVGERVAMSQRKKHKISRDDRLRATYPFIDEVREDYRKKLYSGTINAEVSVPFTCKKHGEYWQSLKYHKTSKYGCEKCATENRALESTKSKWDNITDIRPDYAIKVKNKEVNGYDKVPFICPKHGEYWQRLGSHSRGSGCNACAIELRGSQIIRKDYSFMNEMHPDDRKLVKNGELNSRDKARFVCSECGEWFTKIIQDREAKGVSICQACSLATTPRGFYEFLCTLTDNITVNDRQQIKPKEIDFYLPDHNIGFEFDDIRTHQTLFVEQEKNRDNRGGKPQSYHYDKYKLCKESGIRLIQIWDVEWQDDRIRPILQSVIRNALGMNARKLFARNCELIESNSKECNPFFLENHIQGVARGNGYFALKYNGEIVGAICYADKIKLVNNGNNNNADVTISRMCFKQNTTVVGGASKLLKAVTDLMETGQVIEYLVLNDYFDGISFEATGWENAKWYSMVRYYDYNAKRSYYRSPSKYQTRKELCIDKRMSRYYTSGTTVYRKNI